MAAAESSSDQRMCEGNEGVVFEDAAPLLVCTLPASILCGSFLARKLYLMLCVLNWALIDKSVFQQLSQRGSLPPLNFPPLTKVVQSGLFVPLLFLLTHPKQEHRLILHLL